MGLVKGLELVDFSNKVCAPPQLLLPTSNSKRVERGLQAAEKEISLRSANQMITAHDNSALPLEVPYVQTNAMHQACAGSFSWTWICSFFY